MSRSYRKTPMVSDQHSGGERVRQAKRNANKAVRNAKEVPNGKAYRKYGDIYSICDYKSFVWGGEEEKDWHRKARIK